MFEFLKSNYFKVKIETKYNFLTGSLTYDGNPNFPAKYYPVILEILLPKNTEVGYIGMEKQKFNGQDIIINRGYNWEVKKVKIINLNGQENIKISLKLII